MSHLDVSNNNIERMRDAINQINYSLYLQGQNNKYVIAEVSLSVDKYAILMYDKSTHECKFIEHFAEAVEFKPFTITNEYVLSYCYHRALSRYINDEMLDETNREKFEALKNSKEEENPIIIKYYFK
jgi:hypothetical protein